MVSAKQISIINKKTLKLYKTKRVSLNTHRHTDSKYKNLIIIATSLSSCLKIDHFTFKNV